MVEFMNVGSIIKRTIIYQSVQWLFQKMDFINLILIIKLHKTLQQYGCKTLYTLDNISDIAGIFGIGLSLAFFFIPLGPIAAGAIMSSAISGLWTLGRSTQKLQDR